MSGGGRGSHQWKQTIRAHLAHAQHRSAYLLSANPVVNAVTGIAFWWLLTRLLEVPAAEIGLGYAIISLGTIVGVIAKGGLDTALIRNVPRASGRDGLGLLGLSVLAGTGVACASAIVFGIASHLWSVLPPLSATGWALVGLLGTLLVVTWLLDAWCVAEGKAGATLRRNATFGVTRLLLPVPLLLLASPYKVAAAWTLALGLSALAVAPALRPKPRSGEKTSRRAFLRSARRNVTGSAAEFLPGLLLAPIVLSVAGPEEAGYFGIAWTGATLLFLVSAAIGRSTLAELVRTDGDGTGPALRRGARLMVLLVLPAAIGGVLLAPYILGIFGADYARQGGRVFAVLSASAVFVAPAYLYLALLRAREDPRSLVLFPTGMMVAVLILTPLLTIHLGLTGAGLAWLAANAPFGLYGAHRIRQAIQGLDPAQATDRPVAVPHAE